MVYLSFERKKNIGILKINRPKELNALNSQVLYELYEFFDGLDTTQVHCLIITGSGNKSFIAGADVGEMVKMTRQEALKFSLLGHDVFSLITELPIPVIAAINGYALGGGCELALACDIRLCSEDAIFGLPETGLGIIPGFGATARLKNIIGVSKAKEMIYTTDRISAKIAYKIGLVNQVYEKQYLMEESEIMANKICSNGTLAVSLAKELLNDDLEESLQREQRLFAKCFTSEEPKKRMNHFLKRRL